MGSGQLHYNAASLASCSFSSLLQVLELDNIAVSVFTDRQSYLVGIDFTQADVILYLYYIYLTAAKALEES